MILELSGDFLKAEDCKGGEIVEFLDEGSESEITSPEQKVKKVVNFRVSFNGAEKSYTPNRSALTEFISVWGKDTKSWIGKKFEIALVKVNVFGTIKNSIVPKISADVANEKPQVETVKM